jgi:hypothetical protein
MRPSLPQISEDGDEFVILKAGRSSSLTATMLFQPINRHSHLHILYTCPADLCSPALLSGPDVQT